MPITDPSSLRPDSAVPFMGRVVATLEGSNDIAAGEIVYLSGATVDSSRAANPIPRRLKVKRASATSVGRRLVAMNSGDVGDTIQCAPWAVVQMDTSAGVEGDPVYTDASGVPTLTAAANGAVGFVLGTAATVANGGLAFLCPGVFVESGVPAADIDIADTAASLVGTNVETAIAELADPVALTAAAEAGNAIAVTVAGPAQVAQYRASLYDANGLLGVVASWRLAETGAGAEVSATAKPTLFFTTNASGAAEITVTDVSAAHAGTVYLVVEPASVQAGARAGGAAMLPITFA